VGPPDLSASEGLAGGATLQSSAFGALGGSIGGLVPGEAGAGAAAATSGTADLATVFDAGVVGVAGGLAAYVAYKALDAAANSNSSVALLRGNRIEVNRRDLQMVNLCN
jgi:hypothetical protein